MKFAVFFDGRKLGPLDTKHLKHMRRILLKRREKLVDDLQA